MLFKKKLRQDYFAWASIVVLIDYNSKSMNLKQIDPLGHVNLTNLTLSRDN